jgi:hypothetical protein
MSLCLIGHGSGNFCGKPLFQAYARLRFGSSLLAGEGDQHLTKA